MSCLREKAQNSKQDLFEALTKGPDSLTKTIAESVIAPMLEPPDKQPSWKWIQEKVEAVLNDARNALNGYKKTVAKAVTPLLSFVRSKIKGTSISSALATDGSHSDQTVIFVPSPKNDPDGSGVVDDEGLKDADIDPNIPTECPGYSYTLERYLRDKRDCRYLLPGTALAGWDASKELDKIYLGSAIDRFERVWNRH
jgi:hypothetical protein